MKNIIKTIVLATTLTCSAWSSAFQEQSQLRLNYTHEGVEYPPVFFVTNIEDDEYLSSLEGFKAFSDLNEQAVGLPLGLRILKAHRTKSDGTQFSTLMLSASTLGIIPVVSTTEFKVRYDIFVQGKSIAEFEYSMDSTDVNSMWTMAASRDEKPSESEFMRATIAQFLNELKDNEEVKAVFDEYFFYFPSNNE